MKKYLGILIFIIVMLGRPTYSYALSDTQYKEIQAFLDEACQTSRVPGMSVSIIYEGETCYVSSGYADLEQNILASEYTQYELASVSKAFTAVGILLLEEQGLLDMTDSISDYLPWLTFLYKGQPVDISSLTLNHFLHHTTGLTNEKHMSFIPEGDSDTMLLETIELLVNAELSFEPGTQYSYGTVNYDVLGLVIETISGQSYEDYMEQQVLQPLGLHHTYMYQSDAHATGQLAQGYRTSFMINTPYDAPMYRGNKPAGYILSSTTDMARWMGIQMGIVQDIPDIFRTVIEKSHQGDMSVTAGEGMYYAGGWLVNEDKTIIEHTGSNPNYTTSVVLLPKDKTAICLLTNGANTNVSMLAGIKAILDGEPAQPYTIGSTQSLDVMATIFSALGILLTILFFILGVRRKKKGTKQPLTCKNKIFIVIWLIMTIGMGVMCCIFPMYFGQKWSTLLVWQGYSLLTTPIILTLLFGNITWFIYAGRYLEK